MVLPTKKLKLSVVIGNRNFGTTNYINDGYYFVHVTNRNCFCLNPFSCPTLVAKLYDHLQKNRIKVNEYGFVIGNRNFGIALFQRLKVF